MTFHPNTAAAYQDIQVRWELFHWFIPSHFARHPVFRIYLPTQKRRRRQGKRGGGFALKVEDISWREHIRPAWVYQNILHNTLCKYLRKLESQKMHVSVPPPTYMIHSFFAVSYVGLAKKASALSLYSGSDAKNLLLCFYVLADPES